MKHFVFCAALILFGVELNAQKNSTFIDELGGDREIIARNGIYKCSIYSVSDPAAPKGPAGSGDGEVLASVEPNQLAQTMAYDEMGNLIKMEMYNEEDVTIGAYSANYGPNVSTANFLSYDHTGKLTTNRIEQYDSGNRIILQQTEVYTNSGVLKHKEEFMYNELGLCTEKLKLADGIKQTSTYMYDEQGRELEEVIADHEGTVLAKNVSKYDDKGNLVEWTSMTGEDQKNFSYRYEYNELGRVIQMEELTSKGAVTSKFVYDYNTIGALVEVKRYNGNRLMERKSYSVNENGLTTERIDYNQANKAVGKFVYKYDQEADQAAPVLPDFGTQGEE